MKIGITLTSSLHVGQEYIDLTHSVAERLANEGHGIVYGGTAYGMMHELAKAYKQAGGTQLIGVMSRDLMAVTKGYEAFEGLDETHTLDSYGERKDTIFGTSDAMLILPGGYGTLDEFVAVATGKINKLSDKPIALYNYGGFYDTFIAFCNELKSKEFSKIALEEVVFVSDSLDEILRYFETYKTQEIADKFV